MAQSFFENEISLKEYRMMRGLELRFYSLEGTYNHRSRL